MISTRSWRALIRKLFSSPQKRFLPWLRIETLEHRIVPATITWINSSGGNWDVGSNWSGGNVPGPSDDAVISTSGPATIVIQSGDTESVSQLTVGSNDTLSFAGGYLTIGASSTLSGSLSMTGGQLTATGVGVKVTVRGTTSVSGANLDAESGATLALPNLTTDSAGVLFQANGAGSILNLSALTSYSGAGYGLSIVATNGGEINLTGLTSLIGAGTIEDTNGSSILNDLTSVSGFGVYLDGTDSQVANTWTSLTSGSLNIGGGSYDLPALTDLDLSAIDVTNGGQLSLPNFTSYECDGSFQASGAGSLLNISALTSYNLGNNGWGIDATSGGDINLSGLTSLNGNKGGNSSIFLNESGGTLVNDLTSLSFVNVLIDGSDPQIGNTWTQFISSSLTVAGGSYTLPNLTDISSATGYNGSDLNIVSGGRLDLPGVTTYSSSGSGEFGVSGAGSVIDLSNLTSYSVGGGYWTLNATSGGTINLNGLSSMNSGAVILTDTGASTFLNDLTSLSDTTATLDGTDTQVANTWTSFTDGNLDITGGSYSLPNLTDIDGTSLEVSGGVSLTLPGVATYSANYTTFASVGTGSVLSLPALTSFMQSGSWALDAEYGGELEMTGLTSLVGTNAGGGITLNLTYGGTFVNDIATVNGIGLYLNDVSSSFANTWTTLIVNPYGSLTIAGGSFSFASATDIGFASISVNGGGTLSFPVAAEGNIDLTGGQSVTVAGTVVSIPMSGSSDSTIDVPQSQGLNVSLDNTGTLTGLNFIVGAGSTVALSPLNNGTFGGTLTGSGGGTVQLDGNINVELGGLTLNFPGSMLQWTGGSMELSVGDATNRGTINLSGPNQKQIYADGTFYDYGSIVQTGTGDFGLHSDNITPTTLMIEPGGQYLLESDAGINNLYNTNAIDNAGTIRKTAGAGTSTLQVDGSLINTGTIEADSGTLNLDPTSLSQLSGSTLSGGTWNALDGATLEFLSGTAITENAGNLAIGGSGATIAGISGLTINGGSFTVGVGAAFATAGNLSNSGTLSVGGALTVDGNYTQTSAGTFDEQIGGSPTSNSFGQTSISGTASLAGTFSLEEVNGYELSRGENYEVLKFAGDFGAFSQVNGIPSSMSAFATSKGIEVGTSANPPDLVPESVTAPTSATVGQPIAIDWQVEDANSNPATGDWQDSVYLSTTPTITSTAILLGSVTQTAGLAANATYSASLSANLPAVAPGSYYLLVQVDSLFQTGDADYANNILAATTGQLRIGVPAITLGTPTGGSFTAADQNLYYQVTVPAGGSLQIALSSSASSGSTALYVSPFMPPTPYDYQDGADVANQPNQTLLVPQVPTATIYYVLAESISGAAATSAFTLTATQTSELTVSAPVAPWTAGNGGNATVEIDGTNFAPDATASLTLGGTTIHATSVDYVSASQIFVAFDLSGAATGNYTLQVKQGAESAQAGSTFQVVQATIGNPLELSLNGPASIRAGRSGIVEATITNVSNDDIAAPLLTLNATSATVSLPSNPAFASSSLSFLAASSTGNAGILTAGETVTIPLDVTTTGTEPDVDLQLTQTDTTQPFSWADIVAGVAEYVKQPNAAAAVAYLENEVGATWGSYVAMLDRSASLIPAPLGSPNDVKDLFDVEFNEALAAVNTSMSGTLESSQSGVPIAGLTLTATSATTGTTFSTTTLNDGSFAFASLPPDSYTLSVRGELLSSNSTYTLAAGQQMTGVILNATSGAQIVGHILDQVSNLPISEASIAATNETTDQAFTASTDANGNYDLTGLPSGVYDLAIVAPNYARAEIAGVDVTQGNASVPVSLAAAGSIAGTIVLGSGGPQESTLTVTAAIAGSTGASEPFSIASSSTSFALGELPAGTYDVTLTMQGYMPQTFSDVAVGSGQSTDLGTAKLSPAAEIDGTVTSDDQNEPASEMLIQAMQGDTIVGSAITNSSAEFQIQNLPAGTYTLVAPLGTIVSAPTATLATGQTLTGITIQLQPGGTVSGTVTSTDGSVLAGMVVYLSGPGGLSENATTDGSGDYGFEGLGSGSYQVYLAIGGTQTSQTVAVTNLDGSSATANLKLPYAAAINGTLSDSSGNPITDGTVALYSSGSIVATAQASSSGDYEFLVFQPGTFDLSASASEGTFPIVSGLIVPAGGTVTQNFETGTGTIVVSATDGSESVAGDTVSLQETIDGTTSLVAQTTVAANGTASFAQLAAGNYDLSASAADGDYGQTTVDLASGQPYSASVTLAQQAAVSGTVTTSFGIPVAGAEVLVQTSSNLQEGYVAITASDGNYSLLGVAPGTYDVTVVADGYVATVVLAVSVSGSTMVDASLAASSTTASGSVEDSAGNPVPDGTVTITDASGHVVGVAEIASNGTFSVTTVVGTNLSLQVSAQGYAPQSATIDVPAGTTAQLDPVRLQSVAIDPGSGGSNSQPPLNAPDGQAWADAESVKAEGYRVTIPPLPPAPQCESCLGWYSIVKGVWNGLNAQKKIIDDQIAKIQAEPNALNAAIGADGGVITALSAGAAYGTFKAAIPILQKLFPNYTMLAYNSVAIVTTTGTLEQALAALANDVYKISAATSYEQILQVANQAKADAQSVVTAVQTLLNDIPILKQVSDAIKNFSTLTGLTPVFNQLTTGLTALLQQAESLTGANGPFTFTTYVATRLQGEIDDLNQDESTWFNQLDNFNTASDRLAACEAQPCQLNPPGVNGGSGGRGVNPIDDFPDPKPADPNSLTGPVGYGAQNYIPDSGNELYTIEFENDGTAAADDVVVTERVADNLDWSTFQFGSFAFGSVNVTVPTGLTQYQTTVSYQNSDGTPLKVLVSLNFDVQTGLMTTDFTSIDPTTGQSPTGVLDGFLYPESESQTGSEGFVEYTVQPKTALPSGTTINQQASVVFDTNAPIDTETVTNTIDAMPPTSSVSALASNVTPKFAVSWTASDGSGSGVATYTIYESTNGGSYTPWLTDTPLTSDVFSGTIGDAYSFYSVATDNVGNVQTMPSGAEATTTVVALPPTSTSKSTLTISSPSIASGTLATIELQAVTSSGQKETTGGLTVGFKLLSKLGGQGTIGPVVDNGNGTYTATFTGTLVGSNSIEATIGGVAVSSPAAKITVTPGALSLAKSLVAVSATSVASGSAIVLTLQPEDAAGNKLNIKTLLVAFSSGGGTGSGTFSAAKYNANGTYTATLTGAKAGSISIAAAIGGSPITSATPTVTVVAGVASTLTSVATLSSSSIVSGSSLNVTLQAEDKAGNLEKTGGLKVAFELVSATGGRGTFGIVKDNKNGTYTATFTGTTAGTNEITATIGGIKIATSAQAITVTPGLASPAKSLTTVKVSTAESGVPIAVVFQAKDAASNDLTTGGLTVTFALSSTKGATGTFGPVVDNHNGTYSTTFTGAIEGTNAIVASIKGAKVTSLAPAIRVTPGTASTETSTVAVSTKTIPLNGTTKVTLQAKDAAGNDLTIGGLIVSFVLENGSGGQGTFGSVTDNRNGTYTVAFKGTTAGTNEIMGEIGGQRLSTLPASINVA